MKTRIAVTLLTVGLLAASYAVLGRHCFAFDRDRLADDLMMAGPNYDYLLADPTITVPEGHQSTFTSRPTFYRQGIGLDARKNQR